MNSQPHPDQGSWRPAGDERVRELCDEFESEWAGGGSPSIEAFLGRVAPPQRAALLHCLAEAEIIRRAARGPL
jgi:hypothetical protein